MKLTGSELFNEKPNARRLRRVFLDEREIIDEELEIMFFDMKDELEQEHEKQINEYFNSIDEEGNAI